MRGAGSTMARPTELRRDDVITERYWNNQDNFRVVSVYEHDKLSFRNVQQFISVLGRKSGGHWKQLPDPPERTTRSCRPSIANVDLPNS